MQRAYTGRGTALLTSFTPNVKTARDTCPSGFRVIIQLQTTVDVGPFAGLLLGGQTNPTLKAQATSCQE